MIGRFASPGVYRELLRQKDFYVAGLGALLALAGYLVDWGRPAPSGPGNALALAAVTLNGLPIVWGALKGLWRRQVNVDELVSLAIVASLLQGEYLTAAVVSFVMTLGALIEAATSEAARQAIKSLLALTPRQATVLRPEGPVTVPLGEVRPGDRVLVKPGDLIPVDAVVLAGDSLVDESSLTGEPIPSRKRAGDEVMAGTLNQNGVLEARATQVGEDSTLGQVVKLVAEAELHRPQAVRLMDRYARWFTPAILGAAALAWALTGELSRAVAVMIVGCPCALILAAPTATVAALGRAAKAGVLVKGGRYLEVLAGVKAVVFDKTGTLTRGEPRVQDIACAEGVAREEILASAAAAEQHCTHPLARAVLLAAHYARVAVQAAEDSIFEIGQGVRALVNGSEVAVAGLGTGENVAAFPPGLRAGVERCLSCGSTPLLVYRDQTPVGLLDIADQVRPMAGDVVAQFKGLGLARLAVLSGDHELAVQKVAASVGIGEFHAKQKPQDKVAVIRSLQAQGLPVMFVGDGINDAPALAVADVGVAMGAGGAEVALETAAVALTHDDIARLPWLFRLSRRMLGIIKANLVFGLVFNAFAVLASGLGWLPPIWAAVVHNVGSVLVVLLSASLAAFPDQAASPAGN